MRLQQYIRVMALFLLAIPQSCESGEQKPLTLSASTLSVAWQAEANAKAELPASVTITASTTAEVIATSSAPWLVVAPGRGNTPIEFKLTARTTDLPAGAHTAQVMISPTTGGTPLVVQATLTVAAPRVAEESWVEKRGKAPLSPDALTRVKAATVLITSRFRPIGKPRERLTNDDFRDANGTGFIISDDGLVATNNHVVASVISLGEPELPPSQEFTGLDASRHSIYILDSVTVRLYSGTPQTKLYPAQVVFAHPYPTDIAVIRFFPEPDAKLTKVGDLDPANRTSLANLKPDETFRVWAIGFPMGRYMEKNLEDFNMSANPNGPDISVREGVITALRHDSDGYIKAIEHSCPIERGNSGGPLVDSNGGLMGIISLGGDKSQFAIPREIFLDTFFQTLSAHGYGNLFIAATSRILVVDPNAKTPRTPVDRTKGVQPAWEDHGGVFASIADAQTDSWEGDTIQITEGTYELKKPLIVYTGRRIRGAGKGKTILRYVGTDKDENYGVCVGGKRYSELSDLTIDAPERCGLLVAEEAGAEVSVHDIDVRAASVAMLVLKGARAQITNCRMAGRVMVKGPGGTARLHRLEIDPGAGPNTWYASWAITVEGETSPSIEGCRIMQAGTGAMRVFDKATPRVRGCEFSSFNGETGLEVSGAKGDYAGNWFWSPNGPPGARVGKEADVRLVGNVFIGDAVSLLAVAGDGAHATLSGNLFVANDSTAIRIKDRGVADLTANTFRFGRNLDLSAWAWSESATRFPYARAVAVDIRSILPPDQRRKYDEELELKRAEFVYGARASGEGTSIVYRNNSFSASGGGTAVKAEEGATAEDGGGNTYKGR